MEELLTENNTEIHQLKPEPKKKKHSKIEKRNAIFAYCMVAVGFIHFCIFYIYQFYFVGFSGAARRRFASVFVV